jgi:hypothetical protein
MSEQFDPKQLEEIGEKIGGSLFEKLRETSIEVSRNRIDDIPDAVVEFARIPDAVAIKFAKQFFYEMKIGGADAPKAVFPSSSKQATVPKEIAPTLPGWVSQLAVFQSSSKEAKLTQEIAANLPCWVPQLCEEHRADLIVIRAKCCSDQPLTWFTHLEVNCLTLKYLWEVAWSKVSYGLQRRLRPMRRPRLR